MSNQEDDFTVVISDLWIRQFIERPLMAIADLSASVAVGLSELTEPQWEELQAHLADDGSGTEECRAAQATLLIWLQAERKWGLMRRAEQKKEVAK